MKRLLFIIAILLLLLGVHSTAVHVRTHIVRRRSLYLSTKAPSANSITSPISNAGNVPTTSSISLPTKVSNMPTVQYYKSPTMYPSVTHSDNGTNIHPSIQPSSMPNGKPSTDPSTTPTIKLSSKSSPSPSDESSINPSTNTIISPSTTPSLNPNSEPSFTPSLQFSANPSLVQSTMLPSANPTSKLSSTPSVSSVSIPSTRPSSFPTVRNSTSPSISASVNPSTEPSSSGEPTNKYSVNPSLELSMKPSLQPSMTSELSLHPSFYPSRSPIKTPSSKPSTSDKPSLYPSVAPSTGPSVGPTSISSHHPSIESSTKPSSGPTSEPSSKPTSEPSSRSSLKPSTGPTFKPSKNISDWPSLYPSLWPSVEPSIVKSTMPSQSPSKIPSESPSKLFSNVPSYTTASSSTNTSSSNTPSVGPSANSSSDSRPGSPNDISENEKSPGVLLIGGITFGIGVIGMCTLATLMFRPWRSEEELSGSVLVTSDDGSMISAPPPSPGSSIGNPASSRADNTLSTGTVYHFDTATEESDKSCLSYSDGSSDVFEDLGILSLTSSTVESEIVNFSLAVSPNENPRNNNNTNMIMDPSDGLPLQQLRHERNEASLENVGQEVDGHDDDTSVASILQTEVLQPDNRNLSRLLSCFSSTSMLTNSNSQTRRNVNANANKNLPVESITQNESDSKRSLDYISVVSSLSGKSSGSESTMDFSQGQPYEVLVPGDVPLGLVVRSSKAGPQIVHIKQTSPLNNVVDEGDFILSIDGMNTRHISAKTLSKWLHKSDSLVERTMIFMGRKTTYFDFGKQTI